MSHPLIYRGHHIVLTMSARLHYHIGNPFAPSYDSLEAAYAAIDSMVDN
jgi:hypothetical protein